MTEAADQMACAVPGCRGEAQAPANGVEDCMCAHHLSLAKPHQMKRLNTTARRLTFIESLWADEAAFDRIVSSDRYLKLSSALGGAQESVEAAWAIVKLGVLSAHVSSDSAAAGDHAMRAVG